MQGVPITVLSAVVTSAGISPRTISQIYLVTLAGVEPTAFPFGGERSNPLSYRAGLIYF